MSQSKYMNLDAASSVFFDRQLEHIKSKLYEVEYPEFKARQFIPVSNEGGGGLSELTYRMEDKHGVAKLISDYAADLPRAEVSGSEFVKKVRDLGISAAWSVREIEAAARLGMSISEKKLRSARFGMEHSLDLLAQLGDSDAGIAGFLNHSAITPDDVANGASTDPEWETKTADEILKDVTEMYQTMVSDTLGIHKPNMLLVPESSYALLVTKPRSTNSDMTLLNFIKANYQGLDVQPWYALETAGDSSSKRMVMYKRDPDVLTLEIPKELTFLAPEARGLEVVVSGYMSVSGVILYRPKAVVFRDHI